MREAAIEARGLTKRYGEIVAVDAIDLDVPGAEIVGVHDVRSFVQAGAGSA